MILFALGVFVVGETRRSRVGIGKDAQPVVVTNPNLNAADAALFLYLYLYSPQKGLCLSIFTKLTVVC